MTTFQRSSGAGADGSVGHAQERACRVGEAPAAVGAAGQPFRLPGAGEGGDVAGRRVVLVAPGDSRGSSRTGAGSSRDEAELGGGQRPADQPGRQRQDEDGERRPAARSAAAGRARVRRRTSPDRPPQIERRRGDAEDRRQERPAPVAAQDVEEQGCRPSSSDRHRWRGRIGPSRRPRKR